MIRKNSGIWRTWTNRDGGVTGRIREHMQRYHGEEFLPKVTQVQIHSAGDSDKNNMEYSPELFAECLAQWMAVDDQVCFFGC